MLQFCSVSNSLSHTTLSNKERGIFFKKTVSFLFIVSLCYAYRCICIMWIQHKDTLTEEIPPHKNAPLSAIVGDFYCVCIESWLQCGRKPRYYCNLQPSTLALTWQDKWLGIPNSINRLFISCPSTYTIVQIKFFELLH